MQGLAEIASVILSRSTGRVEVYAENIANISTPGYKRRQHFSQLVDKAVAFAASPAQDFTAIDFAAGKLIASGGATDLALIGRGFFTVRSSEGQLLYTRDGQFQRDGDGRLVNGAGQVLQGEGGDLVVGEGELTIAADGTVSVGGAPVARLALADFAAPEELRPASQGAYAAGGQDAQPLVRPQVRQGALEASNVSIGEEMVGVMAALRQAETGQKLMMVYDDLMGRVLTTYGQV